MNEKNLNELQTAILASREREMKMTQVERIEHEKKKAEFVKKHLRLINDSLDDLEPNPQ